MAAITNSPSPNPYRGNNADYPDYLRDVPAPDYAGYGQRAKRTMPMPSDADAQEEELFPYFDDALEIRLRGICRYCEGSGTVPGAVTNCPRCHRTLTREDVQRQGDYFGFRQRMVKMPCCGHDMRAAEIIYRRPACRYCDGGIAYAWVRWNRFLDLLREDGAAEETTSAIRIVSQTSQASQAHHRDEFARSGEPTAPPARPDRHTPTPQSYQQQQQQRHTPNPYSPHMAPVSPVTPHVVTPLRPGDDNTGERRF